MISHITRSVYASVQITEANFFTVCHGEWPWEELHLTSDHLRLVQTWVKGLEALIEACRSDSRIKHNAHGSVYFLQCCYLKLYRKHGDGLSPTDALKEFAQVKQWKAKQVDCHHLLGVMYVHTYIRTYKHTYIHTRRDNKA